MRGMRQFVLTLLVAIVVVIGAEVGVVMAVGKEGLRRLPVVGELFTVSGPTRPVEPPRDARVDEVEKILAKLKEQEAVAADQQDRLAQMRELKADVAEIERRNRLLFERIRQLYPIIAQERQDTLELLAKKYEKTSPVTVAQILDGMTDHECAELLLVMNDRASAKVLEAFGTMGESRIEQERNRTRSTKINQLMRDMLLVSDENAKLFTPP